MAGRIFVDFILQTLWALHARVPEDVDVTNVLEVDSDHRSSKSLNKREIDNNFRIIDAYLLR